MRIKNFNNAAFSLLEILLASIIFVLSISGVFITLNAVRKPVADKESALAATVFGKQVLEALRAQVNAQSNANFYVTCSGNCTDFSLALGQHQVILPVMPNCVSSLPCWPSTNLSNANVVNSVPGVLTYTVSCADGTTTCGSGGANPDMARQVNLNVNWPDAP